MISYLSGFLKLSNLALIALFLLCSTQVNAAQDRYSIAVTPFTFTTGSVASGSLAGSFDYDTVTNATSNINLRATLNGVEHTITGSAPLLSGSFLVFTNNVEENGVTAWIQLPLPASGQSGQLIVFAGFCRVQGDTCNSSNYGRGNLTVVNEGAAPGPNAAPVADAGPDQTVASSAVVTLNGAGSTDADSDPLTYSWSQISGASVTLSSATAAQPTFTAPNLSVGDPDATLVFSLTVNDGTVDSPTDSVTITVSAPTTIPPTAPTALVATAGDGQVSVAFTAPSSDGGSSITDYEYQLDGGAWESASTTSSPVVITGLTNGTSYSIKLRAVNAAGNGAESAAATFTTPSPASEFEANEDVIRQVLVDDAQRSLSATLGTNRRMMDKAKDRFAESQGQMAGEGSVIASRNNVAFDVDGSLNLTDAVLSTKGSFFEQNGTFDGSYRRLLFGDFDLQRNNETGSTTLTLSARLAWEHMLSQQTMLGYFIGGELGRSQLSGTFDGDQDRVAVSAGVYGVQQLADNVVLDGFLTLGAGRNNLEMTNGVLDLESDYVTRTATAGASISGAYEFDQYEFRPSFSLNVGRTLIGDVDFTGAAYGLVDDTLSLDAGSVTIANIILRPEMVWALDGDRVSDSNTQVAFAPRLVCERVIAINRTQNCGSGAELGLTSRSRTGMSNAEVKLVADRIGDTTRSSLVFSLEHQF